MSQYQMNKEAAELAHSRAVASLDAANNHTAESSNQAIKAAGIVNGGAAVALLALVGNMVDKDATVSVSGEVIGFILLLFVAGIAASTFASGGAYFTNYFNVAARSRRDWDYKHPYIHETLGSRICGWIGGFFRILTIVLVLCSYGLFVYGSYLSKDLIITTWTSGQKASQGTTPSNR